MEESRGYQVELAKERVAMCAAGTSAVQPSASEQCQQEPQVMDMELQALHLPCCVPAWLWPGSPCCPPGPLYEMGDFPSMLL